MKRALILACGNPLRGDDGIAPLLARSLRAEFCDPQTETRSVQQWTPELAQPISASEIVLFLDASITLQPGEVRLRRLEPAREFPLSVTHSISPESLLALAVQLYSRAPEQAFLLTIGGASFDHADQLSEPVRSAVPRAMDQIKAVLSGVSLPEIASHSRSATS
jgi:hydrogenase maturation protease